LIKLVRRSKLFAGWSDLCLDSGQDLREGALIARRVECRLAAILASDHATGNFIEIVQCVPACIAAPSQDLIAGSARAKPAARGSVIEW